MIRRAYICVGCFCATWIAAADVTAAQAGKDRVGSTGAAQTQKVSVTRDSEDTTAQAASTPPRKSSDVRARTASLEEVLEFAQTAYAKIGENIADYTCVLYKREFVDGEVAGWQSMAVKIRHERQKNGETEVPFSVYIRFLKPERVAGRAVLYVQDQNNGDLIARRGGTRSPNVTVRLVPTGPMAMEGNRYPITEIGFQNLAKRLIEVLEQELEYRDGELQVWENAMVGDRKCTHYRLTHHTKRANLTYHMAEVSVDTELGVPIRYGAYDFPAEEGGKPQLLEQYVYTDVHVNVDLTDKDFDPSNPEYSFQLLDENGESAAEN